MRRGEPLAFLGDARRRLAQLGDRDLLDRDIGEPQPLAERLGAASEVIAQRAFRRSARMADGESQKPHAFSPSRARQTAARVRFVHAPHAFEIVIGAHLGAEHVHDDIARIHQHPIAGARAVHGTRAIAGFLQAAGEMLGDRGDMPRRAAGRDHQRVGQRRPPSSGMVTMSSALSSSRDLTMRERSNSPASSAARAFVFFLAAAFAGFAAFFFGADLAAGLALRFA